MITDQTRVPCRPSQWQAATPRSRRGKGARTQQNNWGRIGLTRARRDISRRIRRGERRLNSTTDRPPHNFLITEMCFTLTHPAARNLQALRNPSAAEPKRRGTQAARPATGRESAGHARQSCGGRGSHAIAPETGWLRAAFSSPLALRCPSAMPQTLGRTSGRRQRRLAPQRGGPAPTQQQPRVPCEPG
jgi:hypothetical protein